MVAWLKQNEIRSVIKSREFLIKANSDLGLRSFFGKMAEEVFQWNVL